MLVKDLKALLAKYGDNAEVYLASDKDGTSFGDISEKPSLCTAQELGEPFMVFMYLRAKRMQLVAYCNTDADHRENNKLIWLE